tara:strand:+ start:2904 stop:3794 length:891 start_codon:yes stop_codon:yes gene_type:complete
MLKLICPNKKIFDKKILLHYKKYFKCSFLEINQSKFEKIVHNFDVVLLRFNHFLNFKSKTKIRYILSPTTGLTHINDKFKKNPKFKIFNLKDKSFLKNIRASSEFTLFLILATVRKFKSINQKRKIGMEINNKTVGVIGLGRIGICVAKFCSLLGAKVIYFDQKKFKDNRFKKSSLNLLLKKSDIISICIPANTGNINFLSKSKIKLVKKGVVIINTSRGEVVDERYLFELAKKKFLYYSTDVIQNEQFIKKNKYLKLNKIQNIFVTNHIAGLTEESIYKTDKEIFNNFIKFYEKN